MGRMLKIFCVLAAVNYIVAASGNIYLFNFSFFAFAAVLVVVLLKLLIKILVSIFSEKYRRVFQIIISIAVFFVYSGLILNFNFFPKKYSLISIVGDAALLLFSVFLGWIIVKKGKKSAKYAIAGLLWFCLFLVLWLSYGPSIFGKIYVSKTETLQSLPYALWVPAGKTIDYTGVIKYDRSKAYPGLNLCTSNKLPEAYLFDMEGKIVHTWSAKVHKNDEWCVATVAENGDLFVTGYDDKSFTCVDWNSNEKWRKEMIAHHDIAISPAGDIYTLSWKNEFIFKYGIPLPIKNDYIVIFTPSGEMKKEISVYGIFKKDLSFRDLFQGYFYIFKSVLNPGSFVKVFVLPKNMNERFEALGDFAFDIFHDNRVQFIERDIPGLCKKGNILLSMRNLDLIAIVDIEKNNVVWQWGRGVLDMQHFPTLLENNNILVFDNGTNRGYTRVLEINPFTRQVVWEYKAQPPEDFFSQYHGSCQRLPNGNTLICESMKGRFFEVTKEGEIVWECYNFEVNKVNKTRASTYRLLRVPSLPAAINDSADKHQ